MNISKMKIDHAKSLLVSVLFKIIDRKEIDMSGGTLVQSQEWCSWMLIIWQKIEFTACFRSDIQDQWVKQ